MDILTYLKQGLSDYQPLLKGSTREIYKDSLWFVPRRMLYRLVHPRLEPVFFPPEPKLALFDLPPGIHIESDRPFRAEDFAQGLTYRGVMGVGLHLADLLGYRRIVLLGVDLHTHHHFFDEHPLMKANREWYNGMMKAGRVFEAMIPKRGKHRTMDEYYYAVQDLYFGPRGVQLYVGNRGNMLSPRIPLFPGMAGVAEGAQSEVAVAGVQEGKP